ncbi:FecR family protein [Sphingomonas colocasiae]|uniref:FecR family protein n=1 Tax=Sphingomonas colocasiae TaxID=1848973 RepID=A0ABS7PKU5_9SPHN|nr:FecR family protein [Sphingomonas colocasiae]MBY8821907.1 FecR family protein [Sphingomonas colocasiae]
MIALRKSLPIGLSTEEAASHWLTRMDAGRLDDRDQAEFDAWLAESRANADAFEQARRAWSLFDDADGDPHLDALRAAALSAGPEPRRGLWLGMGVGIAASLLVAIGLGVNGLPDWGGDRPASVAAGQAPPAPVPAVALPDRGDFATARGEKRLVKLADGSAVTLNTDSAIRIGYTADRRLVTLLRGQALFEVARNKARPFVVQAGDRQVTALGTIFQVRLDSDRMKVTLVEGKVVVDGLDGAAGRQGAVIVPTVLAPGEELVAMLGAPQKLGRVDVDQQLRWRDGFVEFDDMPLDAAVREINRYSGRQLVIHDGATGKLRVSGVFRTGDPERFAAIVGELLPVRARDLPDNRIELVAAGPNDGATPK